MELMTSAAYEFRINPAHDLGGKTHVKWVGIKHHDLLVQCLLVTGYYYEPGWLGWVVPHELSRRGPSQVHLQHLPHRPTHKRCHVKDIVVRQKEEVVCIVETVYGVVLLLNKVPALIKLVDIEGRLNRVYSWPQAHAHHSLYVEE